jgi:hypothetical protein
MNLSHREERYKFNEVKNEVADKKRDLLPQFATENEEQDDN